MGLPDGAVEVLRSSDAGATWTVGRAAGLDGRLLGRVKSLGGGLLATGGDGLTPAAWVSKDGLDWRAVQLPVQASSGGSLSDALIGHGRAILSGTVETPSGSVGALWIGAADLLEP